MAKDYDKYIDIPENKDDRMQYIFELLKINEKDKIKLQEEIEDIKKRSKNKNKLNMTFFIVPEGIARPRKGKFGKFYIPNIGKFYDYMDKYLEIHQELKELNIITECRIDCKYYLPIPSDMRRLEKVLAELKYIRCIKKPDWDNLGKGTDMLHKIWIDDSIVSEARVRKYYSFKPRIEISISYYKDHTNSYHKLCISKILERGKNEKERKKEKRHKIIHKITN